MVEFITDLIGHGGYIGIIGLMFLENIFPPIPSEMVMPFAGFVAVSSEHSSDLTIIGVIIAGTIGSVLGTFFWYYIARIFGEERFRLFVRKIGRPLTLTQQDIDIAKKWFSKYGKVAVLFGRLLPAVRTLISVPAGIIRMPLGSFILLTTFGSLVWVSFLTFLGVVLDAQYEKVESWLDPVSKIVLALLVIIYIYRLITYRSDEQVTNSED